jgi:thioredoxin-related protein
MKKILLVIAIFSFCQLKAQQTNALIKLEPAKPSETKYIEPDMKTFSLYNPYENADSAIKAAEKIAAKEGKHVFLQMGGNWCIWCARFNAFTTSDKKIDSIIKANYVVVHVNYSKENKNKSIQEKYEYPARFGFPVFVILDAKGKRLHTQNSGYLEKDKNYSKEKVFEFFESWAPDALNAKKYDWLN